jgi:hypothetical protein
VNFTGLIDDDRRVFGVTREAVENRRAIDQSEDCARRFV